MLHYTATVGLNHEKIGKKIYKEYQKLSQL